MTSHDRMTRPVADILVVDGVIADIGRLDVPAGAQQVEVPVKDPVAQTLFVFQFQLHFLVIQFFPVDTAVAAGGFHPGAVVFRAEQRMDIDARHARHGQQHGLHRGQRSQAAQPAGDGHWVQVVIDRIQPSGSTNLQRRTSSPAGMVTVVTDPS